MSYQYTAPDSQRSPLDRQPPNVFSGGQVPSFKTNVNRMKTKRWIESKAPSYDDWDDYDDGYGPEPSQEQSSLPPQPHNPRLPSEPARSFTDPHATATQAAPQRRPSFDTGDDRRTFSSSAYPQPQLNTRAVHPSHAAQLASGPTTSSPVAISPTAAGGLRSSTQSQPYSSSNQLPQGDPLAVPGSRQSSTASWNQSVVSDAPSAQMEPQQRRDFSPSALPPPLQTRASPAPGDNVGGRFPARESSLSRSSPITTSSPQTPVTAGSDQPPQSSRQRAASNTGKVMPIIRPADIYKRMEEEREKERRSMDSSRPSLDSVSSRATEDAAQSKKAPEKLSSESLGRVGVQKSGSDRTSDDGDLGKPMRPTLAPVAERKSEYMLGFSLPNEDHGEPGNSQQSPSTLQEASQAAAEPSPQVESRHAPAKTATESASKIESTPILSTSTYQHPASSQAVPAASNNHPSLPEVSRFSTFGDDFWSGHQFNAQSPQETRISDHAPAKQFAATPSEKPERISAPVDSRDTRQMLPDTHQIVRKPSPSPTHSRDVSTAIESSDLPSPQQQATTSPPLAGGTTSPLRDAINEARSSSSSPPQDLTMREADLATAVHRSPEKELGTLASKEKESQAVFLESRKDLDTSDFGPSITTSSIPRAESPTKGRVRDLAGKFDDISDSRRNSSHSVSSQQSTSSPTKGNEQTSSVAINDRPAPTRDISFRPTLPGQWDSFSSNAGPKASQPLSQAESTPEHEEAKNLSDEEIDLKPSTSEQSASAQGPLGNQMSALAAAGTAVGEAIKASAGLQSAKEASSNEPPPSDPSGTAKSRAVGDIYVRPLAPERALSAMTASSVAPTPPPKENPMEAASITSSEDAGPPVPLKDRSPSPSPPIGTDDANPMTPQLSTESLVDDEESDRLRKEIVRSLSPVQPRAPDPGDTPRQSFIAPEVPDPTKAYRDSSVLPAEYDSYWAGADSKSLEQNRLSAAPSAEVPQEPVAQTAPVTQPNILETTVDKPPPEAPAPLPKSEPHHDFLGKRFSWEEPIDENFQQPPAPVAKDSALPPTPAVASTGMQPASVARAEASSAAPAAGHLPEGGLLAKEAELQPPSPASAEISPITTKEGEHPQAPRTESTGISPVALVAPQPLNFGRDPPISPLEAQHPSRGQSPGSTELQTAPNTDTAPPGQAQAAQPRFPFFREILAMKSSPERITAYNKTREQFATSDSGLRDWLSVTLAAKPEHADLRSIGIHAPVPAAPPGHARHKRTASLSLFGKGSSAPYYQQYIDSASQLQDGGSTVNLANSPTTAQPHISDKPSAGPAMGTRLTGHQMQAKGKDLLHSAGVLGGKASTISKGLFAKGKNKFRSSGSEKVDN